MCEISTTGVGTCDSTSTAEVQAVPGTRFNIKDTIECVFASLCSLLPGWVIKVYKNGTEVANFSESKDFFKGRFRSDAKNISFRIIKARETDTACWWWNISGVGVSCPIPIIVAGGQKHKLLYWLCVLLICHSFF